MPQAVVDPRLPVAALRALLAVARGDVAEAAQWVRRRASPSTTSRRTCAKPSSGCWSGVLIAEHEPAAALAVLERWRAFAVAQERAASVLRLRLLEALAHDAAGDRTAALRALAEALALAAPEGYVRVFLDEGAAVGALLRELAAGRRLEQLGGGPSPAPSSSGLIEAFDRHGAGPPAITATRGRAGHGRSRCPPASTRCSR